jgi:Protein of unknown function (DUF2393)
MPGITEPSPLTTQPEESRLRPILVGAALVAVMIAILLFLSRGRYTGPAAPHPYAANLQLSNLKMSTAENFVGSSVTYIDGTVTNTGDKTVTHAVVHVVFKNSLDQVAQADNIPLLVLQTTGPYPDTVDLAAAPLAPAQAKQFRLTFEHVTTDWNQNYPEVRVMNVTLK